VNIQLPADLDPGDATYMAEQLGGLTTERLRMLVSEWAAKKRYLPSDLTNKPGRWDNSYTPYLVEIMDCLSTSHPARKVAVRKAAQVGATTGILENFIGYTVDHAAAGMIYVSADKGLTELGVELRVDAMLHHSGLSHLLAAPNSTKRSGDTKTLKQFPGGFLLAVGAQNPGKLRSTAAKLMVLDELDGMPLILGGVGKTEGSPITLSEQRTVTFFDTRKILYLSTPLIMQTSLINPLFLMGDQRHYYIPCVHCNAMQHLEWHGVTEDKEKFGFVFEVTEAGVLISDSVGYRCRHCFEVFRNHDKAWFLGRGEWRPHAESQEKGLVSFHLPSFYSPPGMYPWEGVVQKWIKAWDVNADRMKNVDDLQAFYNLERGLPWEERGESPSAQRVRTHRRAIYSEGEIPNSYAVQETGGPVVLLTCAVDVHGNRLDVEVLAWCKDRQSYSIHWLHFEGDPDDMSSTGPWQPLRQLIMDTQFVADDGRLYKIQLTLIDAAWEKKQDAVYQFCQDYSNGVFPVMGRKDSIVRASVKEFSESTSSTGNVFFNVATSLYKDRISGWLKSNWDGDKLQPCGYPNYPQDRPDDYFEEYEGEEKVEMIDPRTRQRRGYVWRQIGQRPNHAWDCRIYNMCALDMLVHDACTNELGLEKMDYTEFFNYATPQRNAQDLWMPNPYSYHPTEEM